MSFRSFYLRFLSFTRDANPDAFKSSESRDAVGEPTPVFFVQHSDGKYSIASPQPSYFVAPYVAAKRQTAEINAGNVAQLSFLLHQAPMLDAPSDACRLSVVRSPFAYINPKTLDMIAPGTLVSSAIYARVSGSPTIFVLTSFVPEGRMILTPNIMPGMEKRLASALGPKIQAAKPSRDILRTFEPRAEWR